MDDAAFAALCSPALAGAVRWGLGCVLIAAALWDLRQLRIPNGLVYVLLAVFVLMLAPCLPWSVLGLRVLAAGGLLGFGLVAFAYGLFGGGDVKFLAALLLFVPSGTLVVFALVMALSLLASIALILAARRLAPGYSGGWGVLRAQKGRLPMGLAFGIGGLVFWGLLLG
ncbi:MAG TPA: prepilin peptidase [Paracoccaceae bacterium]|nr:prepilin peptidase [Paracoccaceae bacterium]